MKLIYNVFEVLQSFVHERNVGDICGTVQAQGFGKFLST